MRFVGKSPLDSRRRANRRAFFKRGAVLFEVVVALVLFVAAATVITGGLNAALRSVERLRLNAHAADLAVSVLSELQLGVKTWELTGPQPFEAPFEGWTWEVIADAMATDLVAASPLQSVEVIIRHEESELVYRLSQMLPVAAPIPASETDRSADSLDF